jgi:phosphoserine phosphatase
MEILLLRHGETDWNLQGRCQGASDLDLNRSGMSQAEEVGRILRQEPLTAIYSSPLKRAFQTAEIIGRHHSDLPILIDRAFRELDHGLLEGLTFDEIKSQYPAFIGRWREAAAESKVPGGESLAEVELRSWNALQRVVQRHATGTALVVTRNFPILAILCRVTETPLDNYRTFRTVPCAVTRIRYDKQEGWRLVQAWQNNSPAVATTDRNLP